MCLMNSAAGAKKKDYFRQFIKIRIILLWNQRERERKKVISTQKKYFTTLFFPPLQHEYFLIKDNKQKKLNEYKTGKQRGLMCAIENF